MNQNKKSIESYFQSSSNLILKSIKLTPKIQEAIEIILESLLAGKKIVLFGNGGSAADAQHIAAELIGRFQVERKSIAAIALTTDSSIITSLSNDYSYDVVFQRQCEGLVKSGDVVIGISTSGKSKNVQNGLKTAKKMGAKTIAFLGNDGGTIKIFADLSITVDSSSTAKIQEVHRIIYHIICENVEKHFKMRD